jgi:hypothetical protein
VVFMIWGRSGGAVGLVMVCGETYVLSAGPGGV